MASNKTLLDSEFDDWISLLKLTDSFKSFSDQKSAWIEAWHLAVMHATMNMKDQDEASEIRKKLL